MLFNQDRDCPRHCAHPLRPYPTRRSGGHHRRRR